MQTIVDEIQSASKRLGLASGELVLLAPADSDRAYRAALHQFVGTEDRRWWWEAFREPGVSVPFPAGDRWRKLPSIVPNPSEPAWFIAEDDQLPQYPVFETSAEVAARVIGECYGFEYYMVAKDFSWLVCETHHNSLSVQSGPLLREGCLSMLFNPLLQRTASPPAERER